MPHPLSRRALLTGGATLLASPTFAARKPKRVAAVVTLYTHNSHADVIVSKLLQTESLDGKGRRPGVELVGLYVDQSPKGDISRRLSTEYGFPIYPTIREALTLGTGKLAVDGVLLIGEHGDYPHNELDQELYPRKRFFDETVRVFRDSGRVVPMFNDKHLSHSWPEAKEMYDTAHQMGFPLMAGSSVPGTWRRPPLDVRRGAPLREIVAVSYHTLYGYGFHALEMVQALAERRRGGETGVRRVQCLEGDAVWEAGRQGRYSPDLLDAALGRLSRPVENLRAKVQKPVVFLIEYRDGLRASILTLNYAVGEWAAAWRADDEPRPEATLFWTQEARPLGHFTFLVRGIERLMHTGKAPWPVERTLLTSGVMDAILHSRHAGGTPLETPHLNIRYHSGWDWKDPGPPPPSRPLDQQ